MDPIYGAWEWIDLDNKSTLHVFTVANHISERAPWVLKLANRIPYINIISGIFISVLTVEKQAPWVKKQMEQLNGSIVLR